MRFTHLSRIRYLLIVFFLCIVAGWTFYFFGLESFLRAVYSGESLSYFNEYASRWRGRQSDPNYESFLREARALLFRFGLLGTVSVLICVSLYSFKPKEISSFLAKETSPFNLSLFRIAVFGVLLSFNLESVQWYARLPANLQSPPPGWSSVAPFLSTDPTLVSVLTVVFQGACLFGLLGLYTRIATIVALVTGLYVLGIPQFYGKVNHYHYVFWCAALLIPSRCADVLSLDVLRHQSSEGVSPPESARVYALPIRYAWILLGIVYFFPGFWKFVGEGFAWALSENVKYNMHMNWFLNSFKPFFRLDRYPFLYQSAGLFTLIFEMGFVYALPFRSLRPWLLGAALGFHEANRIFLGIFFDVLYPFLFFLIDLRSLLVRAGDWFYSKRVVLTYDPDQAWQKYVAGSLRRMDLFDRLRAQEKGQGVKGGAVSHISVAVSDPNYSALWVDGRLQWRQFLALGGYVPVAIPLLPLAFLVNKTAVSGSRAVSRAGGGTVAVSLIGGLLIVANGVCGVAKINSYPFSVYPTFAVRADSTVTTLRVEGVDASERSIKVLGGSQDYERTGFSQARFRGLVRSILQMDDEEQRAKKLNTLWDVLRNRDPAFRSIVEVRFYEATYVTNPDRSVDPLVGRSLIERIRLD